jgi:hypothetical protein
MKITVEVSEKNEGTRAPWWMIINPRQNLRTDREASYNIAEMITGPFFSREEAKAVLDGQRYNFGRGAVVFCASGQANQSYCQQIDSHKRVVENECWCDPEMDGVNPSCPIHGHNAPAQRGFVEADGCAETGGGE